MTVNTLKKRVVLSTQEKEIEGYANVGEPTVPNMKIHELLISMGHML